VRSLALLFLLLAPAAAAAGRPPNIVVIVADDLGFADLGVQGSADVATPHIDSIAREGVRFLHGYVCCPVCAPSRAGFLTGRYPQRFGLEFNPPEPRSREFGLPLEEKTLAERLRSHGYATGMVGKWHLGFRPELTPPERGFAEFFGFLSGMRSYFPREKGEAILRGSDPVRETDYLTTAFGREAAGFVDRHRNEPFFLYLAFNSVHAPLEATDRDLDRFPGIADPKRRAYAAMLASMDDAVGALLGKLRETGLEESTLLFFLSDNGGPTRETTARNRPLRGRKGQLHEGGIRVPFFARWKGRIRAGRTSEDPVIALDIAATALAAAGLEAPKEFDGVDLLPHIEGRTARPPHDALFWRYGDQRAVRAGEWKLFSRAGREELYHLGRDEGEERDLAQAEPERARALRELLARWETGLIPSRWPQKD
jgi:arylsulfatase A-like enzyme